MGLIQTLVLRHVPVAPASLMSQAELVTPLHHTLVPNALEWRPPHLSVPLATWQRLSLTTSIIFLLTVLCQGSAVNETAVFNIILHTSPWPNAQRAHVCLLSQVFTRLLLTGMVHTKDLTVVFVPWAWTKNCYNSRYNIQKIFFGPLKP